LSAGLRLHAIAAGDPPDCFPDPDAALRQPNGLLAFGGDLAPQRLLNAYERGIFPWFSPGDPILWWSPDPRAVLLPGDLHIAKRLRRTLRTDRFLVSVDQAFDDVIAHCASIRQDTGTWLGPAMIEAYRELHRQGAAHSIEVWQGGVLVGGLYGVQRRGAFFGESMFSLRSDASKIALVKLAMLADEVGIAIVDCQLPNEHLARMGVRLMARHSFLEILRTAVLAPCQSISAAPPTGTAQLAV
jgi:leucyl/phenylalanyl-tRNA---protein transferase